MNNIWKWVYNPFEFVAGWSAFGIGIVILAITTVVGFFGNMVFYGISAKTIPVITWSLAFSLQALGLAVLISVMCLMALLFAKGFRFQDILGTVTLAKYPLLLMAFLSLVFSKKLAAIDYTRLTNNDFAFSDIAFLLVFSLFVLIILFWSIALLYNAFKVSTNLKGNKCAGLFIATLFISEIIIQLIVLATY
jgi:hypothetical protein